VPDEPDRFPRHLIKKVDNRQPFPLLALEAITQIRVHLDDAEHEAILRARELGASAEDIADALGITRQGAYYKLKALEKDETEPDVTIVLPADEPTTDRSNG
jgi:hypothetical protein